MSRLSRDAGEFRAFVDAARPPRMQAEPSIGEKEFFLRKAIGWALRQYARTDAAAVIRYVNEKGDVLSPLSKREALKNVAAANLAGGGLCR